MVTKIKAETKVLEGNAAVAYGALLCKPNVIAAFPITPINSVYDNLYRFSAEGLLKAEMVAVEGENSSLGVLIGASAAGGRTFTATSSQGLLFMYDGLLWASGGRLPIVMALGMREQPAPLCLAGGQSDALLVKDDGWIQVYAETCQEILDSIIMAYRLAEDAEILLPIHVCYDGFYLSYLLQKVDIPAQEDVDSFLAPLEKGQRPRLCLENPMTCMTEIYPPGGALFSEYRFKHCAAMQRAKGKYDQIDKELEAVFGRSYGGQIEEYRTKDAEIVLVTMGNYTGTARVVVDSKRDEGLKVGLIKIRMFRPFPNERLAKALKGKKAVAVIDRSVCFGWNCGNLFMELQALMGKQEAPLSMVDFIGGLAGDDITVQQIERAVEAAQAVSQGKPYQEVTWLALE